MNTDQRTGVLYTLEKELLCYTTEEHIDEILTNVVNVSNENVGTFFPVEPYYVLYGACYHAFINNVYTYITRLTEDREPLKRWFNNAYTIIPKPSFKEKIREVMGYRTRYVQIVYDHVLDFCGNILLPEIGLTLIAVNDKMSISVFDDVDNYQDIIIPFLNKWKRSEYSTQNHTAFDDEIAKLEINVGDKKLVGIFSSMFKHVYLNNTTNRNTKWIRKINKLDLCIYTSHLANIYRNPTNRHAIYNAFPQSVRYLLNDWLLR